MVTQGKVVSMNYRLTNTKGQELDRSETGEPFSYVHGAQQIIRGLEKAIEGMKVGDKKRITVAPKDAYGEVDEKLRSKMHRSQFPAGTQIAMGDQFQVRDAEGTGAVFEVKKIEGDTIHVDANHPLAGETLTFEVEVVGVRDATAEDMKHQHHEGCEHDHDHGGHGHDA